MTDSKSLTRKRYTPEFKIRLVSMALKTLEENGEWTRATSLINVITDDGQLVCDALQMTLWRRKRQENVLHQQPDALPPPSGITDFARLLTLV